MTKVAHVALHSSERYVVLSAGEDREMWVVFARLPGARLIDRERHRWLLPMVPQAADALRGLMERVEATPEVISWIGSVAAWAALVEIQSMHVRRTRAEVLLFLPIKRRAAVLLSGEDRDAFIEAALEWIEAFLGSDERLVVFVSDDSLSEPLVRRFPECLQIVKEVSEQALSEVVDKSAAAGAPQLCVADLGCVRPELWLDRFAHAAFLEFDEKPALRVDAENCVDRVGNQRALTAWYLAPAPCEPTLRQLISDA